MKMLCVVACLSFALLPSACSISAMEGSGNIVTESREVRGFDRVELSGTGLVVLTQGESEGLTVTADDNLMEHIVTEVENGTLRIGLTRRASTTRMRPSRPLLFKVSFDDLVGLSVSGSGSFELGKLETDRLDVSVGGSGDIGIDNVVAEAVSASISGSGDVSIGGKTEQQTISVSGSGKYRAQDLDSSNVDVSISGSGLVVVKALEKLKVRISGSGTVRYYGRPTVTKHISGSGEIEALGGDEEALGSDEEA